MGGTFWNKSHIFTRFSGGSANAKWGNIVIVYIYESRLDKLMTARQECVVHVLKYKPQLSKQAYNLSDFHALSFVYFTRRFPKTRMQAKT